MSISQAEELSKFRENEVLLQFKLVNGEEIQGRINWFDNYTINVSVANKKEAEDITILKHAISYYFSVA